MAACEMRDYGDLQDLRHPISRTLKELMLRRSKFGKNQMNMRKKELAEEEMKSEKV